MPTCRHCGELWDLDSLHDAIAEQPTTAALLAEIETAHYGPGGRDTGWTPAASRAFQAEYEAKLFHPMLARFRAEGCAAIEGRRPSWCVGDPAPETLAVLDAIAELMGNDSDGAEAMEDDARAYGLL